MNMNDDWKNFEPRQNAPSVTMPQAEKSPLSAEQMAKMLDDPDKLRTLAKSALVEIIAIAPRTVALVGAIKELLDRIDGKAPQSLSMVVKTDPASKLSDDQLFALLALLPDPVIIPPVPKKLEIE